MLSNACRRVHFDQPIQTRDSKDLPKMLLHVFKYQRSTCVSNLGLQTNQLIQLFAADHFDGRKVDHEARIIGMYRQREMLPSANEIERRLFRYSVSVWQPIASFS